VSLTPPSAPPASRAPILPPTIENLYGPSSSSLTQSRSARLKNSSSHSSGSLDVAGQRAKEILFSVPYRVSDSTSGGNLFPVKQTTPLESKISELVSYLDDVRKGQIDAEQSYHPLLFSEEVVELVEDGVGGGIEKLRERVREIREGVCRLVGVLDSSGGAGGTFDSDASDASGGETSSDEDDNEDYDNDDNGNNAANGNSASSDTKMDDTSTITNIVEEATAVVCSLHTSSPLSTTAATVARQITSKIYRYTKPGTASDTPPSNEDDWSSAGSSDSFPQFPPTPREITSKITRAVRRLLGVYATRADPSPAERDQVVSCAVCYLRALVGFERVSADTLTEETWRVLCLESDKEGLWVEGIFEIISVLLSVLGLNGGASTPDGVENGDDWKTEFEALVREAALVYINGGSSLKSAGGVGLWAGSNGGEGTSRAVEGRTSRSRSVQRDDSAPTIATTAIATTNHKLLSSIPILTYLDSHTSSWFSSISRHLPSGSSSVTSQGSAIILDYLLKSLRGIQGGKDELKKEVERIVRLREGETGRKLFGGVVPTSAVVSL